MNWLRILWVGLVVGVAFIILDAALHANPIGSNALAFYKPIARKQFLMPVGIAADVLSGLVMVFFFALLYPSFPTSSGIVKGIVFGLMVSFFRVVMNAAASYAMFQMPTGAFLYTLISGILEMSALGFLSGLLYKPK